MAKNRKRKKAAETLRKKSANEKRLKPDADEYMATAKRLLISLEGSAAAFDVFTKKQKQDIFRLFVVPPHCTAEPGRDVPRHFVRYIQDSLLRHLNTEYFDRDMGLTLMDVITVGTTMSMIFNEKRFRACLSPLQMETVDRINGIFEERKVIFDAFNNLMQFSKIILVMLSQPNFRVYGFSSTDYDLVSLGRRSMRLNIVVTSHPCQSVRFSYHNRERISFRIAAGQFLTTPYTAATIRMSAIYPNIESDRVLNIYIQPHAIHRFKERIDTIDPFVRNEYFFFSLFYFQHVTHGPDGSQFIECMTPTERGEKCMGYFTFTIDGDNLHILTILPILCRSTPQGRVLSDRLGLSDSDMIYLGMDKLSFFYNVDIGRIPQLKRVLFDELHLEYIRGIYNFYRSDADGFDEKKTLFVESFFRKMEEHSAAGVGALI
ncbi:MAG: hypothetical protein LBF79_02540 [Dysgonamonadaceae bacterium]|jgi:hypothetical protein|nr:hypothetical protein [Dysgonamonadaceae bacterium]